MKKLFCFLLIFSLLLCGCAAEEPIENPVYFYYRTEQLDYFGDTGVIDREAREAGVRKDDYAYLLNQYLLGPEGQSFAATFPRGTGVVTLEKTNERMTIVLNREFAQLTGLDLSLACACLTLTACQLTGAKVVTIYAENALLDGSESVTMDYSRLVLEDLCRVPVEPD